MSDLIEDLRWLMRSSAFAICFPGQRRQGNDRHETALRRSSVRSRSAIDLGYDMSCLMD